MRTMATMLFWVGRLEMILLVMLLVHAFVIWRSRWDSVKPKLVAGWLVLSIVFLVTVFSDLTLERSLDGLGYVRAHLYEGIWSDEEAWSSLLMRWRNVWLPAYLPWLCTWLTGLIAMLVLSGKRQRSPGWR